MTLCYSEAEATDRPLHFPDGEETEDTNLKIMKNTEGVPIFPMIDPLNIRMKELVDVTQKYLQDIWSECCDF